MIKNIKVIRTESMNGLLFTDSYTNQRFIVFEEYDGFRDWYINYYVTDVLGLLQLEELNLTDFCQFIGNYAIDTVGQLADSFEAIWEAYAEYKIPVEPTPHDMALCEGRHVIPEATDGAIFPSVINPFDVEGLEAFAIEKLQGLQVKALNLYTTGLTIALVSVLNACRELDIPVILYHFDRESDSYYRQVVY